MNFIKKKFLKLKESLITDEKLFLNRRKFMNVLAKPENSLKMYQSGLELLKMCEHENLSKEIIDGINYYTKVSQGYSEEKNPSEFKQLDIAAIKNPKPICVAVKDKLLNTRAVK